MFFIIWRGPGFLVIAYGFGAVVVAMVLGGVLTSLGVRSDWAMSAAIAIAAIAGAAAIWFTAKALSGPSRRLVDPATGQTFLMRRDAGSLFFIPTRYWAFVLLVVGLFVAIAPALPSMTPTTAAAVDADSISSAGDTTSI